MRETEIKLLIDAADAGRIKAHPLLEQLAAKRPYTRQVENRYYDTEDLALAGQGIALRLRRMGGRWLQTLKRGNAQAVGLHQREEWETPVPRAALNLRGLARLLPQEDELASMLPELSGRLRPRVLTRFRRTLWNLKTPQDDLIEFALDLGEIIVGKRRLPIAEVELELKAGRVLALYELARELARDLPLALGGQGKAERGFTALRPRPLAAIGSQGAALDVGMNLRAVELEIMQACLVQIQSNAGILRQIGGEGELQLAGECVHQLRVGLRRLRVALKLFAPLGSFPETGLAEIRSAAALCGPARDWDVLAEQTMAWVPKTHRPQGWNALDQAVRERADDLRKTLAQALDPWREARWQLELMAWVLGQQEQPVDCAAKEWATEMLLQLRVRLAKRGRRVVRGNETQRHRARIAAKQLRYALEFFAPLIEDRSSRHRLRALSGLQDALGRLNDAAVGDTLLAEMARQRPELTATCAWVQGWLVAAAERQIAELDAVWAPVAKALRR